MANSITGINDDIIAMAILEAFTAQTSPLAAFSTNFSDDAARRGDKISILRTIAADAALSKTTHADYTVQDADSDAVEISLGQPDYVSWGLDDVEIASSSVVNMEVYGQQKGFVLAKKVLQTIWGNITAAQYGAAVFAGAAAGFDSDDVAAIKDACDVADMPESPRALVLSPSYANALLIDTGIKASYAYGDREPVLMGSVPRLFGFDIYVSNLIPDNGENLKGFVAHPSGMAVGMRYLMPQEGNKYNRAERLTDPESGIVLGLRDWYDEDSGVRKRVMECVYGYVTGIAAGIKRITS